MNFSLSANMSGFCSDSHIWFISTLHLQGSSLIFHWIFPYELLYGKLVRGSLDVLLESREANAKTKKSVVSYVLSIHNKLDTMYSLATDN